MKNGISIRESKARIGALEATIKDEWRTLADDLVSAIPTGMHQWFLEQGRVMHSENGQLIPSGPFQHWLEQIIDSTVRRGLLFGKTYHENLDAFGFQDFQDMEAKFAELELAWSGVIKVRLYDDGPGSSINIYWAASEYHDLNNLPPEFQ